jgi:hypothetical protein
MKQNKSVEKGFEYINEELVDNVDNEGNVYFDLEYIQNKIKDALQINIIY